MITASDQHTVLLARFQGPWTNENDLRFFLTSLIAPQSEELSHSMRQWLTDSSRSGLLITWLRQHGLASLAYHQLQRLLPPQEQIVVKELQPYFLQNMAASMRLLHQIKGIKGCLLEAGFEPIFLKGVALVVSVYPQIAWRTMGDIDFLVKPSGVSGSLLSLNDRLAVVRQVGDILSKNGYKQPLPDIFADVKDKMGHHVLWSPPNPAQFPIEVHWSLGGLEGPWHTSQMSWFFDRLEVVDFENNPYLILQPSALLLHLTFHLTAQHGLKRSALKWLVDIQFLISCNHGAQFWQDVVSGAKHLGWSAAVLEALQWVGFLFGTQFIPDSVIEELGDDCEGALHLFVQDRMNLQATKTDEAISNLRTLRGGQKWLWAWRVIMPKQDYMRWRYPHFTGWKRILAYPRRWFDIGANLLYTLLLKFRALFSRVLRFWVVDLFPKSRPDKDS